MIVDSLESIRVEYEPLTPPHHRLMSKCALIGENRSSGKQVGRRYKTANLKVLYFFSPAELANILEMGGSCDDSWLETRFLDISDNFGKTR